MRSRACVVNAFWVVVTAQSRERVKRHTVVGYKLVVQVAVGVAVPTEMVELALVVVAIVAEAVLVAAIAVAEVASVVDTGGEVVHFVATVEMTPRRYVVVDCLRLVEVASSIPLTTLHN